MARPNFTVTSRGGERGFVAVATAILLTVLLLFVALGIDSGQHRDRLAVVQRVADSAALAAASALPDLTLAQQRANEAVTKNDPSGQMTAVVQAVTGKPGRVNVTVTGPDPKSFASSLGIRKGNVQRVSSAEQSVGIPMGTPYNSIGTGDLPGTIPGDATALQGYFLAINGPCTAKEDGDRFMSRYDGIRGSVIGSGNEDAYHCTEDTRTNPAEADRAWTAWTTGDPIEYTTTLRSQWKRNTEYRPGGYSYIVTVPCNDGTSSCPAGTPVTTGVYVDVWDPWFRAWKGEPPCALSGRSTNQQLACAVDKVPIAREGRNWVRHALAENFFKTKFAIYPELADGTFSSIPIAREDFGGTSLYWFSSHIAANPTSTSVLECEEDLAKWQTERRGGSLLSRDPGNNRATCKDWFALHATPIARAGRYRVQVAADPVDTPPQFTTKNGIPGTGAMWNGPASYGLNTYALRVRRANQTAASWVPCTQQTDGLCATITGESALSVYVKTPGNSSLYLSKMAPSQDYRGRTIQVQLWDPGEGAQRIKILMPVHSSVDSSGYEEIPFRWSTADPGLVGFESGVLVEDRAVGWTASGREGVAVSASAGVDVSGTYGTDIPWPKSERYSQAKFNGRLLILDITIPASYGTDSSGADVPAADYQGGWWKILYESGSGVEDRTTWVVQSSGGPVHLVRGD